MPLKLDSIEEPQLNLTPMIDIVFLLVIFFMVGTQFTEAERQYDIRLPSVSEAQPLTGLPDELLINIRQDGQIFLGTQQVELDELQQELEAAAERYADQTVVIRGDARLVYQRIMSVLAASHEAGIVNVQLAGRVDTEGSQ